MAAPEHIDLFPILYGLEPKVAFPLKLPQVAPTNQAAEIGSASNKKWTVPIPHFLAGAGSSVS
jgi:hypothetical protein